MRLVWIVLGWTTGIIFAARTDARPIMLWLLLVVLSFVVLALLWPERRQRSAAFGLIALTLGGLRFSFTPVTSDVAQYINQTVQIEGIVIVEPEIHDTELRLQVATETVLAFDRQLQTNGTVLIQTRTTTNARYGDRVAATGYLINPGESDTFSYRDFLARSGVFAIMQNAAVEVVSSGHGNPISSALIDLKTRANAIIATYLPEPNAALLSGIVLGSENGIAQEVETAFSRVGASHVIAISGFNMALLSSFIMRLLENRVSNRWAAIIGISVIGIYTIFVGANAGVVRAAIMSSMLVIGGVIKRKTYVPTSLAFVALLMTIQNPNVLWDIGFQLSLFATLGLALFADPIGKVFNNALRRIFSQRTTQLVGGFLAEPLVVSIAAQILTLPLIVLYFGRLSPVSLLVNLLIIPVQSYLLIVGILALQAGFFLPVVAQLIFWIDMTFLAWTIAVVRLFARLPFADVEFYVDPRLITLFFAIVIGGAAMRATQPAWVLRLAHFVSQRLVTTTLLLSGGTIALLLFALVYSRPDGKLHLWMLDIGHTNAILVQSPGGAQILIDGGRFPSRLLTALGDRLPFNDREIETLIITQPDEFDISALNSVVQRYSVGVVLTNGHDNRSEGVLLLNDALSPYPSLAVSAGYSLDIDDGVHIEVLHPQTHPQAGDSFDDHTMVLRLTYNQVSFLLTGDLSQEGQIALLEAGEWPVSSVMQLPKHGTIRSLNTAFLEAAQPQIILLQSDETNRLGDPNPDTLTQLGDRPLFRTDEGGHIHIWSDGVQLWVEQDG